MELTERQETILQIVKDNGPITGEHIADRLSLTRATLRPDLAILTMSGFLEARPRVGYYYTGKTDTEELNNQLQKLTVKHYQSIAVVVSESDSVYDAICTMFLEDVGTLFVVDKQSHLAGVLSRKDLLRASLGRQDTEAIPVSIIMTRMPNITICKKEDLVVYAATKLIERQIDALPVVKDAGGGKYEVVGRITKTNITKVLVDLANNQLF
ncbi:helix-turn-helix transcriptional regulator [Marinococcus sp. PL1-022]|uniref:helix-turn-helix transcriptional regulator n=1 Tax=Marinococcus sp. PL1-022 TaxID=3095363 RepID=UPI0029C29C47|nr:helix-turn-helix transcriptional regulator [Marinococcus sp. PL1-022]MDX6153322.1 helix-turn-helix transcriptional regulator [Marinococcus sp. PL1-022]